MPSLLTYVSVFSQMYINDRSFFILQNRILDFTSVCISSVDQSRAIVYGGFMDIQHLFRIGGDIAATVSGVENRRGREHHQPLFIRIGVLQRIVFI